MLFSKSSDSLHLLNSVAGFIWTCCDGKTDVKAIKKALQEIFVDNSDGINEDLFIVLKFWQKKGIISFNFPEKFNYENTIFLAGSGRSGTTWLAEIINYDDRYRFLFEPFHFKYVDIVKHFPASKYLRKNDLSSIKFTQPIKTILSGHLSCCWTDRNTPKTDKIFIKDIRAHLFLKWIKVNCPQIPIVFLMRHPCAVVVSQIRHQLFRYGCLDNFQNQLNCQNNFLSQPELVEDFLFPFKEHIQNATTEFEKAIFAWCIENYIPLKQLNSNELYVIFYEGFCIDIENELDKLFNFLGSDLLLHQKRVLSLLVKI